LVESAAAFVRFARANGLIAGETVAIDGTKLRAVASRKAVVGQRELEVQAEALQRGAASAGVAQRRHEHRRQQRARISALNVRRVPIAAFFSYKT